MPALSLSAAVISLGMVPAHAASNAWSTTPASALFTGTNWTSGTTAGAASGTIASGDSLYFGTSSTTALTNDETGFTFAGLTFNSGASAFTIGGNAFTLSGSIINNSTNAQIINTGIALSASQTITANTGAITLGGVISDGGSGFGLTKTGNSTLLLSGANTYSGNTTIQAGTVQIGSSSVGTAGTVGSNGALTSSALGTGSVILNTGASTLDLNGQTFGNRFVNATNNTVITNTSAATAFITGADDGSLNSNVISDFSVGSNNGDITWTGKISRTNQTLGFTKTGTDTVTFSGTTANVGVGSTADQVKVNAGTLVLGMTGTSAGTFGDSVTVQGGTLKFAPALGTVSGGNLWGGQINGNLQMTSGTIDLNGSTGQNSRAQQFYGTGGTVTNTSAAVGILGISARNNTAYTFGGTIQDGAGTVGIDFSNQGNTSNGRINLFTGTNTYSGATTISYGTFELGSTLAAQNSTVVVNAASGLGTNSTYSLTTTNPLAFANGIGTFTIGGLSGAGNVALTDIGRTAAGATAAAASVTLQVGSNLAANATPAAYSGVLSDGTVAGGQLAKIGSSTLVLTGANTYTGATTISSGTLQLGSGGTTGTLSPSSAITDNDTLAINRSNTVTQGTDFSGSAITGTGKITKTNGTLVMNAANTYSGGTIVNGGTLQLGSSTNVGVLTAGPLGIGTVQLSNGSNAGGTLDLNGQTLSNAFVNGGNNSVFTNSSATPATVSTGFNTAGAGGFNISDFTVTGTGDINWSGSIRRTSFFGNITKSGTNTLTLSGAGTGYTGLNYTVSGGTLALNMPTGSTFNSGAITDNANVAGAESGGVTNTVANTIGGSGTLTQSGAGTTILTAANTYSGGTNVNAGTLIVNNTTGSGTGSGTVIIASTGTLAGTGTITGAVTDSGTINPGGVGSVGTLTTGADTFNAASSLLFDFGNNTIDQLISTGTVSDLSGVNFLFNSIGNGTLTNSIYTLVSAGQGFATQTLPTSVTGTPSGYQLQYTDPNTLSLVQMAAAPEPSQWAALLIGALGLGGLTLRARRRATAQTLA